MEAKKYNVCRTKKTIFGWSSFNKPTPARVNQIAVAVAAFLDSILLITALEEMKWLVVFLLILRAACRDLIPKLFSTEETTTITEQKCEDLGMEDVNKPE